MGGTWELFGGNLTGKFLELEPGKKIVETWRFASWPACMCIGFRIDIQLGSHWLRTMGRADASKARVEERRFFCRSLPCTVDLRMDSLAPIMRCARTGAGKLVLRSAALLVAPPGARSTEMGVLCRRLDTHVRACVLTYPFLSFVFSAAQTSTVTITFEEGDDSTKVTLVHTVGRPCDNALCVMELPLSSPLVVCHGSCMAAVWPPHACVRMLA